VSRLQKRAALEEASATTLIDRLRAMADQRKPLTPLETWQAERTTRMPSNRRSSPPSLTDTMRLLGLSGDSWAAWRAVAKVLEGQPLTPSELELYAQCTSRATPPTVPPSEVWIIAGRRSGKSRFAGALAVHIAGFTDYAGRLAPGEQAVVALAASDREQARVLLGYAVDPFTSTDALRPLVRSRSLFASLRALVTRSHRWGLDLSTHLSIEIRTAHFGRVRGRTYALAIADEASFWASEDGTNPASAVLQAIRPGLATLGGRLLVITTPYSRSGVVWDTFSRFHGVDNEHVLVWSAASRVMNPTLGWAWDGPRSITST
jgi:hypothetical protein